jgi:triosephosphate isomerase
MYGWSKGIMRLSIIAGNWKMNTTVEEAQKLVLEMRDGLGRIDRVEKVLCPPFVSLLMVRELVKDSSIKLGAQNMHFEAKGAFTGEISPLMLTELCEYVILGHSERRQYFGETNEMVNRKVQTALKFGLKPILCVGESLAENQSGKTEEVIHQQVKMALAGVGSPDGLVIAYEPIWAIGTGIPANGKGANETIKLIRQIIAQIYGDEIAQEVRLQYGGSVTKENIAEFISQPEIDGALVGGASLKGEEFLSIVEQAAEIRS